MNANCVKRDVIHVSVAIGTVRGGHEIDLIAVNEIEKTAEVYEIKKQGKRYDEAALSEKIEYLLQNCKELHGMRITLGVLTLADM